MKKISFITLVAVSMVILCSSCDTSQSKYDRDSFFDFPQTLGGLERFELEYLESKQRGLGTAATYGTPNDDSTPGLIATIYVFNYGKSIIPSGIDSAVVKEAFRDAMYAIQEASRRGFYELTSSLSNEETYLVPSTRGTPALKAQFSFIEEELEFMSYLYVYGKGNQIVKVRVTNLKEEDTIVQPIRQSFLKAVSDSIL
jgi:hypothetical protein